MALLARASTGKPTHLGPQQLDVLSRVSAAPAWAPQRSRMPLCSSVAFPTPCSCAIVKLEPRCTPVWNQRRRWLTAVPGIAVDQATAAVVCTAAVGGGGDGGGGGGLTYREAGVDIDAGDELVRRIAKMAPAVGGFGGLFPFGDHYLVAGTDGVGTKLKLAFELNKHDTIGIDLVAMSVNDIITSGAKPLFFLDYYASSKLNVDVAEQVIKGIVEGCQQSDCALLGGETAEMPGFYAEGEYDLSGFAVGSVLKTELIDGRNIAEGDVVVGLPSSGVHSNGFSLVRRVLQVSGASLSDPLPGGDGSVTIGQALLAPTVIYVKQVLKLLQVGGIKGIAHITGGGMTENIPRIFPDGLGAEIRVGTWKVLPIFDWIHKAGNVAEAEMRRTYNMGVGMVLIVDPMVADRIVADASSEYGNAWIIGKIVQGRGVSYVR